MSASCQKPGATVHNGTMNSTSKLRDAADIEETLEGLLADSPFFTERSLAKHWNISPRTLQRWRANGTGPRHVRIGDSVRYRPRDVLAYEVEEDAS